MTVRVPLLPPPGSVRRRLLVWNVGVLAFVLVVVGAVFRYRLQADSIGAVDNHLARVAREFQQHFPPDHSPFFGHPPPWQMGRPTAEGLNSLPPQHSGDENFHPPPPRDGPPPGFPPESGPFRRLRPRLLNPQGRSLFPGGADAPWDARAFARALHGQEMHTTVWIDGEPVRVCSLPLRHAGHVAGVVQTANSLEPLRVAVNQMTRTLLTLIPLALLIAGIGGAFLTDRALRPVRDITRAAEMMEAENLSGRLPITGKDEFSHLASTFNAMLARLEGAFARLEAAYLQQRRFAADASHELRTPLTIIKANTSLALAGERTPAQYRQALAAADKAADRMNRIVQDLLLLARSDAGQWEPQNVPTPLAEVLAQAAEPLRAPHNPPIALNLRPPDMMVQGDPHALLRLFANLLENAVRHTPPDGLVTLQASADNADVRLDVSDTGEGIAPEHLPHVTERFYRVDAARARADGGTGLGLAICLSIVQAHGGTMRIESVPGHGTTVRVTLPRAAAALPDASPCAPAVPAPAARAQERA